MPAIYLLNKPFQVLSQFTDKEQRQTLSNFISTPSIYPAGRLDYDSEGLIILTGDGSMQARIAEPKNKLSKTYWVQVEGSISQAEIEKLQNGILLKDGKTLPAKARIMKVPKIWPRNPPIRHRQNDITSWIELSITEGRNRQVRRMTAHLGFPTLRLIRYSIGPWSIEGLAPGEYKVLEVNLPTKISPKSYNKQQNRKTKKERSPKTRN